MPSLHEQSHVKINGQVGKWQGKEVTEMRPAVAAFLAIPLLVLASPTTAQRTVTPVSEILKGTHTNQTVTVEGRSGYIVREESTPTTTVYTLRDDFGDEIRIRASNIEGLQMGVTYRVRGTAIKSGRRYYIIELDRVNLGTPPPVPVPQPPPVPWWQENWLPLSIGASAIVLALLLLALYISKTKQEAREEIEALRRREEALRRQLEEAVKPKEPVSPPPAPTPPSQPLTDRPTDFVSPEVFVPPRKVTEEMWGTLEIIGGPDQGKRIPLGGRRIVLGRTEGDIRFPNDSTISSQHAEIVATSDGRILFVDHSRNGSKVNEKVVHYSQVELQSGDTIEIGLTMLRFTGKAPAPVAPSAPPLAEEVPLSQQPAQLGVPIVEDISRAPTGLFLGAELEVLRGPDKGKRFPLVKTTTTIGRLEDKDIRLTDITVSRSHCVLEFRGGKFILRNESTQGTRVNGELVQEKALKNDDEIEMGGTVVKFITVKSPSE